MYTFCLQRGILLLYFFFWRLIMNSGYYQTIFKRKSFHLFANVGSDKISGEELKGIEDAFNSFERLYPDIRMAIRIVPSAEVGVKRDSEYCILIYSEKKRTT
jgi:hypothetical protein